MSILWIGTGMVMAAMGMSVAVGKVRADHLKAYVDAYLKATTDEERATVRAAALGHFKRMSGADFDMLIIQVKQKAA